MLLIGFLLAWIIALHRELPLVYGVYWKRGLPRCTGCQSHLLMEQGRNNVPQPYDYCLKCVFCGKEHSLSNEDGTQLTTVEAKAILDKAASTKRVPYSVAQNVGSIPSS